MFYLIYNLGVLLALLLGSPYLLFRMLTTRRFRAGLTERLVLYRERAERSIWIQAASVGEVSAALPLVKLLREELPDYRLVLTCQTASGRRVAREKMPGGVLVLLSPLDLTFLVKRFIRLVSPAVLVLIETELWPGMIGASRKAGVPVVIASGRISQSTFPAYRKAAFLLKPVLRKVSVFNMRTVEDADRIERIGAAGERIFVTGNIKFDALPPAEITPQFKERLADRLGLENGDLLLVGGSTFAGEEALLLDAFRKLLPDFPALRLLLAPRHLERVGEVEALLGDYALYSRPGDGKARVVILDRMGVLFDLYSLAAVVFVGRSLRGVGGQNPIEPASWGKPILFGPHMENFRQIARDLVEGGGAVRVADESALPAALRDVLSRPEEMRSMGERARRVVQKRQGAARKNLETIRKLLR